MHDNITTMTWNVNGETAVSASQLQGQLDFIEEKCGEVDVFLLQAVRNQDPGGEGWDTHLEAFLDYFESAGNGYHVVHTGDWSRELMDSDVQPHAGISGTHNRCNVTASRWPIERQPLDLRNRGNRKPQKLDYYYSHFPEKMLVAEIDTSNDDSVEVEEVEVWNVGIINGANWGEEKVNMLETVYGRIYLQNEKMNHPVILGGDFNAPKEETSDRQIVPHGGLDYTNYPSYGSPYYFQDSTGDTAEYTFRQRWRKAEKQIFDREVGEWNMQDSYLASPTEEYEASTVEYTHVIHNGNPSKKRLDHILVSDDFTVRRCDIWNGRGESFDGLRSDGTYKSDHAPVVAELGL